jgi:hypothetical protein
MENPIKLYRHSSIPEINFETFDTSISNNEGARALFIICYTMLPSNAVEQFVSEVFDGTSTNPTKEQFIKSLWSCCSNNFYNKLKS